MRIVGGRLRGLGLEAVGKGDPKAALRPTSDRVREAIFNLLQNGGYGDPVTGARVLDLFAGTGALGLEAISRGAEFATFVDSGRAARALIAANIARARTAEVTRVLPVDAARLPAPEQPATLIFLDPPYGRGLGTRALEAALRQGWVAPGALVVWEENAAMTAPEGFTRADARRYGETWVTLMTAD